MSVTALADWFVDAVRERRIKGWGWFESCVDGQLHLIRHEHPNVWMWVVQGPSASMPGWTSVTPYNFDMGKKKLREGVCRHAHCGEPIYYSDFTNCWLHLSTASAPCPNNTVAEPKDEEERDDYQGRW